ncbi:MAG: hypothetical protein QXK24_09005 [Ignisphaera sp.]
MDGYTYCGTVEIKLIDKKTGNVNKRIIKNAYCLSAAKCTIYALTGLYTTYPITRVILFDSNKSPIKNITGSWGDYNESGTTVQCKFTAIDNSDSEYTFRYLTLDRTYPEQPSYFAGYFCNDQGQNVTKTSLQSLVVEWTISTTYSNPP